MKIQNELKSLNNNPYDKLITLKLEIVMAKGACWFMSEKKYEKYLESIGRIISDTFDKAYIDDFLDFEKLYNESEIDRDEMFNVFWIYKWFKFENTSKKTNLKRYYNHILEQICLIEECIDFEGDKILHKVLNK